MNKKKHDIDQKDVNKESLSQQEDSLVDNLDEKEIDQELDINIIKSKYEDLKKEFKDIELRHTAKIQNLNRIHKKELEDAHKYSSKRFAEEMLIIKDYLEMALQDKSGNFDTLKMGVDMTLKQLVNAFTKVNISEIEVKEGDVVDPNIHSVVSDKTDVTKDPNTILEVQRKGYKFYDRILRPAMVIVSKLPDKDKIKDDLEGDINNLGIDK